MATPDTVLLVDDESHVRMYIKIILKQMGIQTFYECNNGNDAIEMYKKLEPELVMMDINMPGKDGLETLAELIEYDEDAIVIMLTAQASRQMVEQSGKSGAAQYIRKDTPKDEMKRILRQTFDEIWED